MPLGSIRANGIRTLVTSVVAACLLALGFVVALTAPAGAAPAPIVLDDFAGHTLGTRTVTPLPLPNTSTTSPGTFSEANGVGTMTMNGAGNSIGGMQLDYALPGQIDLTSAGNNTQFFLVFNSINRTNATPASPAAQISIQLTGGGVTGSFSTQVASTGAFNIVLNFSCAVNPVCFTPQPDFTKVTHVTVTLFYPMSHDSSNGVTTAVLDSINTTPTGGAVPPPATPSITPQVTDPVFDSSGRVLDFPVAFRSNGAPATVFSLTTNGNLAPADVQVSGTAAGVGNVAVTGSGASYHILVGPLTGSGTVVVSIPAGAAVDTWAQPTQASNVVTANFQVVVPPTFTNAAPPAATVGAPYSFAFTATGTPAPTFAVSSGTLPSGLTLNSSGTLAGTPAATTGGLHSFTVAATNVGGSTTDAITLTVNEAPAFTNGTPPNAVVGSPYDFAFTASGFPAPSLSLTGTAPPGLNFDPATGHLSGTALAGSGGNYALVVRATNSPSNIADLPVALTVFESPAITSTDHTPFQVGVNSSFNITTTGFVSPALALTGTLPSGLSFTDNGDGTATITGTPAAGAPPTSQVTITATNQTNPAATQTLTLEIAQTPAITSDPSAIFVVGTAGTFTVTATGSPTPALSTTDALPDGLAFTDNGDGTATITGTAAAGSARDYELHLSATNGTLPDATQTLTLKVKQAPAFTSPATATFQVGVPGSFTMTTDGVPPATFTLTGTLPPGLTFTDNGDGTATIAGTPSAGSARDYTVTISAANDLTDPDQTLTLTVMPAAQPPPTTTPTTSTPNASPSESQDVAASTSASDDDTVSSDELPFTGTGIGLLAVPAAGMLLIGALMLIGVRVVGPATNGSRRGSRRLPN